MKAEACEIVIYLAHACSVHVWLMAEPSRWPDHRQHVMKVLGRAIV
jgi:hypothetical protein